MVLTKNSGIAYSTISILIFIISLTLSCVARNEYKEDQLQSGYRYHTAAISVAVLMGHISLLKYADNSITESS